MTVAETEHVLDWLDEYAEQMRDADQEARR